MTVKSKGKIQFFNVFEQAGTKTGRFSSNPRPAGTLSMKDVFIAGEPVEVTPEQPKRAKCPTCGFSQKVRKNGTMSRHDVFVGSDPRECEGSGRAWDA